MTATATRIIRISVETFCHSSTRICSASCRPMPPAPTNADGGRARIGLDEIENLPRKHGQHLWQQPKPYFMQLAVPPAARMPSTCLRSTPSIASENSFPNAPKSAVAIASTPANGPSILPMPQAWPLVSGAPAKATGLHDRGQIAAGKRADVILVDACEPRRPRVVAVITGGRIVHLTEPQRVLSGASVARRVEPARPGGYSGFACRNIPVTRFTSCLHLPAPIIASGAN